MSDLHKEQLAKRFDDVLLQAKQSGEVRGDWNVGGGPSQYLAEIAAEKLVFELGEAKAAEFLEDLLKQVRSGNIRGR